MFDFADNFLKVESAKQTEPKVSNLLLKEVGEKVADLKKESGENRLIRSQLLLPLTQNFLGFADEVSDESVFSIVALIRLIVKGQI